VAPSKKPMKTVDDVKASQNTLMSQFFKRKAIGRRPNEHALCTDTIGIVGDAKRKRGPVPGDRSKKTKTGKGYTDATGTIELDGAGKRKRGDDGCPSTLKSKSKAIRMNYGDLSKITKKEILSIMFSAFLVLDDNKMKKDILMDAFVKCYEKSPTKINFLVWLTATTSQATPADTATAPVARGWDQDDAPFGVGASWDPYTPIGVLDTCL
jgi:hypothetical protein